MSVKLIALDMDGTLLASDHATIPRRNLDALREARRRGVDIAIASGRSWSLIRETAEQMGCVTYAITCNGALVLDTATGERLVRRSMDPAQCAVIVDILRQRGLCFDVYADGVTYFQTDQQVDTRALGLSQGFLEMFLRNMTPVDDIRQTVLSTRSEKFDIFYVPPRERAEVTAQLAATGPLSMNGALSTNLELTARGVNKGRALEALCGKLGLLPGQVMAFGDADNDLEMLRFAGWSFAMENGTREARAAARSVTGTNDAGGVGMAVERYVLKGGGSHG